MPRRQYKSKRKDVEGQSLLDYASLANTKLVKLAKSKHPSDKLQAVNITVFILLISFVITHFIIHPDPLWSLSGMFILLVALFLSFLIGTFGYGNYLEVLANLSSNVINSLRIGAITLLIGYPVALIGLVFGIPVLLYLTLGIIVLQTLILLLASVVPFPELGESDKQTETGQFKNTTGVLMFWVAIIDIIITAISIIVSIIILQ